MGKRGPAKTPTAIAILRGSRLRGRHSEPLPSLPATAPDPPAHLDTLAAAEWRCVVPELHALGLLSVLDLRALEAYCAASAIVRRCADVLEAEGMTYTTTTKGGATMHRKRPEVDIYFAALATMHRIGAEFGLSPSARTRLEAAPPLPADEESDGDSDEDFMLRRGRWSRDSKRESL